MKLRQLPHEVDQRRDRLIANLRDTIPQTRRAALELDRNAAFPAQEVNQLRQLGALAAPVPVALGGLGTGTEPEGALPLMQVLRLIGRGSLSLGRLYEAHVNALHLIFRYGTAVQASRAANDALEGHLFALWVTDAPDAPLFLDDLFLLRGAKFPCSGAGYATRALVTARRPSGEARMLVISLRPGEHAEPSAWDAHGMRATASGRVTLDGLRTDPASLIGIAGDYLREPDFSAGAWRTSAVTLGGLEALVDELRRHLVARSRESDPHQLTRVGEALIAQETAHLWVRSAAQLAEASDADASDIACAVNLARIAVEKACLDAIRIVQRALGLSGFRRGELTELLYRDLSIYLRQPAPDEALTEAAAHFMQRDLPAIS